MKSVRMFVVVAAALAMSGLMAGAAHAGAGAEVQAGGYLSGSFPTGDWGEVAGFGLGLENATMIFPDSTKAFGIRQGGSLIYNFGRTIDIPSSSLGANTSLELETASTSLWFGIGPAFAKHTGNVRPFLYGTIGVAFNWIDSHLTGNVQSANYDATVGQTSTTFAWTAGVGVVKAEQLELSVEYRSFIDMDYLLPTAVSSSGSNVSWNRTHQNADQIIVRIGTMIGN